MRAESKTASISPGLAFGVLFIPTTSLGTTSDADTGPVRILLSAREAHASRLRLSSSALARLIVHHVEFSTASLDSQRGHHLELRAYFQQNAKLGCGAGFAIRLNRRDDDR